jgi:hypothetical protein
MAKGDEDYLKDERLWLILLIKHRKKRTVLSGRRFAGCRGIFDGRP